MMDRTRPFCFFAFALLAILLIAIVPAGCSDSGAEGMDQKAFPDITEVHVSPTVCSLAAGAEKQLIATVVPEGVVEKIVWSSDAVLVAGVTNAGIVQAVAPGKAIIKASVGNLVATCSVTVVGVPVAVTSVSLMPKGLKLLHPTTHQLAATVAPENATNKAVTYFSSDVSIAKVNSTGLITTQGAGSATITVTTEDGHFKDSCAVTNTIPVSSIVLMPERISVSISKKVQLAALVLPENATNKAVTFICLSPIVASVSETGMVTGRAAGNTTIEAIAEDGGHIARCEVKVLMFPERPIPVGAVEMSPKELTLVHPASRLLTTKVFPPEAANPSIVYSSSDNAVAIVNVGGMVTSVGAGDAIITVKTLDGGFTDMCNVTVK